MRYITKQLLKSCKQANKVLPKRCLQPILEALKLDGNSITATDLDTRLQIKCPSVDDYQTDIFVIPAKRLIELLSKITTDVVFINNGSICDDNGNTFSITNY